MSSRRILLPENGQKKKDPKRQEAARKAHATMAAQRPARLQAEIGRLTLRVAACEDRAVRAFNRWQREKARLKAMLRRREAAEHDF